MDPQDDPEARIRELERSLSDVAGKSELTATPPTTRTTAGLRGSRTVLLGVAVGVTVLSAVVAIVISRLPGGSSSTALPSGRPSISNTTTSPANQPLQRLFQLLPQGYNSHNCARIDSPNRQALATVQCGQTSDPRSPTAAAFSLYPDATALDNAFQNGIDEDTVTQCPDGKQSPATWQSDSAPNVPAGSVLCGKYDNRSDLMWTQTKALLLGDIQGPDLNALYQFWQDL